RAEALGRRHRDTRTRPAQGSHQKRSDHAARVELVAQWRDCPRLVSFRASANLGRSGQPGRCLVARQHHCLSGRSSAVRLYDWITRIEAAADDNQLGNSRHIHVVSYIWRNTLEFREHTLPNGLEVVAECNPEARSMALGYFVKTGARDETHDVAGV